MTNGPSIDHDAGPYRNVVAGDNNILGHLMDEEMDQRVEAKNFLRQQWR